MAEFRVLPSLNTDMAETNALYVSPADATTPYVKMGRFVYKCIPHPDVSRGTVCMNAIARRACASTTTIEEFTVPLTATPPKRVCVRAEFVKSKPGPMPENLANAIRNALDGLIVSVGQKLTLTHDANSILFEVTDVDAFGIVNMSTEMSVMWAPSY